MKGYVTITGPGEAKRLPVKQFQGNEGTALNVAVSNAITKASKLTQEGAFEIRDEFDELHCTVTRLFPSGTIYITPS